MKVALAGGRQLAPSHWILIALVVSFVLTTAVELSTVFPVVALVVSGVVSVFFLARLNSQTLAILVVLSTFLTRLVLPINGYSLRPEHVMTAVVLVHVALAGNTLRTRSLEWRPVATMVAGLVCYIVWAVTVTLLYAPSPRTSSTILVWFALDAVLLYGLTRLDVALTVMLRWGVIAAAVNCFLAIFVWALASTGGPQVMVQVDSSYGGFAAYNGTLEANILASLVACWAIIGLSVPKGVAPRWAVRSCAVLAPVVALVTHTRTALLAYLLGLMVLSLSRRGIVRGRARWAVVGGGFLAVVLVSSGVSGSNELAYKFSHLFSGNVANFSGNVANSDLRVLAARTAISDLGGGSYWFGLGTNSYGQRHLDPSRPDLNIASYLGNLPLQLVYDTGVIGVALLLLSLVFARRGRHRWPGTIPLAVTYGVTSISTSYFWFAATWLFVVIAVSTEFASVYDEHDVPYTVVPRLACTSGQRRVCRPARRLPIGGRHG